MSTDIIMNLGYRKYYLEYEWEKASINTYYKRIHKWQSKEEAIKRKNRGWSRKWLFIWKWQQVREEIKNECHPSLHSTLVQNRLLKWRTYKKATRQPHKSTPKT